MERKCSILINNICSFHVFENEQLLCLFVRFLKHPYFCLVLTISFLSIMAQLLNINKKNRYAEKLHTHSNS